MNILKAIIKLGLLNLANPPGYKLLLLQLEMQF